MANPLTLAAERYFKPSALEDPAGWAERTLGIGTWSKQREMLESIRRNRYTAVHACHDSSKSFTMAVAIAQHLENNKVGDAFAVSTAPSMTQVDAILWREIRKLHKRGLRGRIIGGGYPQWLVGSELIGYGRKPQDYDVGNVFQGIHAKRVLVVLDEANGLPEELWTAADTLVTNEDARVVAVGNPDDPESHFHEVCQPGSGWNVIHIDGLQTPNFNAMALQRYPELRELFESEGLEPSTEDVNQDLREGLLSATWVVERMTKWGVGSALWEAKVRGRFPNAGTSTVVIPHSWVEAAQMRWLEWDAAGRPEQQGRRIYGVDVAREGEDLSAIATRQGKVVFTVEPTSETDTMAFADTVNALMSYPGSMAVVDVVGVGGGVFDRLRQLGRTVVPFSAGAGTREQDITNTLTFADVRSLAWWRLREALMPSRNPTLCLPPDADLLAELAAPHYKVQGNIIRVESKEQIRKRLRRSTDRADAVIQSLFVNAHTDPVDLTGLTSGWRTGSSPLAAEWAPSHWESGGRRYPTS